jgi:hypothetical protein
MKPNNPVLPHFRIQCLLAAALFSLPLASACSDDEAPPPEPPVFSLTITDLEGGEGSARPHCDGTLAVSVSITPGRDFKLRPVHACGSSGACGYVLTEALTPEGEVLAQATSVTTTVVLQIDPARLGELSRVRATLIRGVDQQVFRNPDGEAVSVEVEPTIALPDGCDDVGVGGASSGGASSGGASSGGAGQAGAAGEVAGAPNGGAPAGGAPTTDAGAPSFGGACCGGGGEAGVTAGG